MEIPAIVTARLVLRSFVPEDLAPFAALNADPRVMEHFPSTLTRTQSDALAGRIVQKWSDHGHGLWAVARLDDDAFIGFVGLAVPNFDACFLPRIEVGWRLAAAHWGQGFAPEAATAALHWGFTHLQPPGDEFVSFTSAGNTKSRRVMEKLGMTHDPADDFDHPAHPGWDGRRHVLYRLARHRWAALAAERAGRGASGRR